MSLKGRVFIDTQDIVGTTVGNWRVLEYDHKEFDMTNGGCKARHLYRCKCSCGTTRLVRRDSLIQKNSRSCGCKRRKHNL